MQRGYRTREAGRPSLFNLQDIFPNIVFETFHVKPPALPQALAGVHATTSALRTPYKPIAYSRCTTFANSEALSKHNQ